MLRLDIGKLYSCFCENFFVESDKILPIEVRDVGLRFLFCGHSDGTTEVLPVSVGNPCHLSPELIYKLKSRVQISLKSSEFFPYEFKLFDQSEYSSVNTQVARSSFIIETVFDDFEEFVKLKNMRDYLEITELKRMARLKTKDIITIIQVINRKKKKKFETNDSVNALEYHVFCDDKKFEALELEKANEKTPSRLNPETGNKKRELSFEFLFRKLCYHKNSEKGTFFAQNCSFVSTSSNPNCQEVDNGYEKDYDVLDFRVAHDMSNLTSSSSSTIQSFLTSTGSITPQQSAASFSHLLRSVLFTFCTYIPQYQIALLKPQTSTSTAPSLSGSRKSSTFSLISSNSSNNLINQASPSLKERISSKSNLLNNASTSTSTSNNLDIASTSSKSQNIKDWSTNDVVSWLESIPSISKFAKLFSKEQIDGCSLFLLNDNDLKQTFGMALGPRKVFFEERKKLET